MKRIAGLALLAALYISACNKPPTAPQPNRTDLLTRGKWRISGGSFTLHLPQGTDTTLNYLDYIPNCHKDDYIVFDTLGQAAVYSGDQICFASDAEKIPFMWRLKDNEHKIDFYNGFNNLYAAFATIKPVRFDTLINDGITLKLDTLVGVFDTPAHGHVIALDSIWEFRIDTMPTPQISIYDAQITSFSTSSFNIRFNVIGTYLDVQNTSWSIPRRLPDTMKYNVTYSSF